MGAYSRELVSVGTCRHFRDSSAASVRQRRVHILKRGNPEVIRQVQFPVCRPVRNLAGAPRPPTNSHQPLRRLNSAPEIEKAAARPPFLWSAAALLPLLRSPHLNPPFV